MKKIIGISCIAFLAIFSYTTKSYGQVDNNIASHSVTLNLGESALLAIKTGNVNLNLSGASEAGAAISMAAADSITRLRISSSVSTGKTRSINVSLSTGSIDGGSSLLVKALPVENFSGDAAHYGTPLAEVELLANASNGMLINNIGLCWSGTGADDGYKIKYTLKKPAGATFSNGRTVTIVYTLSGEV